MGAVRFGVVGVGSMGKHHCRSIVGADGMRLTAVCDANLTMAKDAGNEFGVPYFDDYRKLIDSQLCDAVLIATPHYQHPPIGCYAFGRGLHVMCEKPIAVTPAGADRLIAAARKGARSGLKFGVMFQMRSAPVFRKAKAIIESGALGEIYRTKLEHAGLRTQAYYNSAGWRGTWKGEGGGVLLNQAPHPLDMFTWLGGAPSRVQAWARTDRHEIEVEDNVHALLEYPNGGVGYIYCSVNEAPGINEMLFCGEKGKLEFRDDKLILHDIAKPVCDFIREFEGGFGQPEIKRKPVRVQPGPQGHAEILADFVSAIQHDTPLLCPGEEGLTSLELADAIILSGKTGKAVDLPLDRRQYEAFLADLKKGSGKKTAKKATKKVAKKVAKKTDKKAVKKATKTAPKKATKRGR